MAAFRWTLWFCPMLVLIITFSRLGQSHPFYRRTMDANVTTDDSFPGPTVTSDDRESLVSVQTECDPDAGRANISIAVFPGPRHITYTQVICHNNVFPVLMGFSNVYFPNSTMRDHQFLCLFDGPYPDSASSSMIYNATVSLFWDDGKGSLYESNCSVSRDKLSMEVDSTTMPPDLSSIDGVITETTGEQMEYESPSNISTDSVDESILNKTDCKNKSSENMPPAFPVGAVVDNEVFTPQSTDTDTERWEQTTFPNEIEKSRSESTSQSVASREDMASIETVPLETSTTSNKTNGFAKQDDSMTSESQLVDSPRLQRPNSALSSSEAEQTTVSLPEAVLSPVPVVEASFSSATTITREGPDIHRVEIAPNEAMKSTISPSKTWPQSFGLVELSSSFGHIDILQIPSTDEEYDTISSMEMISMLSEADSLRPKHSGAIQMPISATEVMMHLSEDFSNAMLPGISLTNSYYTISPSFHVPETLAASIRSTEAMVATPSEMPHSTLFSAPMMPAIQSTQSVFHHIQSSLAVDPKTNQEDSTLSPKSESDSSSSKTNLPKQSNENDLMSETREIFSDSKRKPIIVRASSQNSNYGNKSNNRSTLNASSTMESEKGTFTDSGPANYNPNVMSSEDKFSIASQETILPSSSSFISEHELLGNNYETFMNLMTSPNVMSNHKTAIVQTSSRVTDHESSSFVLSIVSTRLPPDIPLYTLGLEPLLASITQMKTPYVIATKSLSSTKPTPFTADINVDTMTSTQPILQSNEFSQVALQNETVSHDIQKPLRTSLTKISNKEQSEEKLTQSKLTSPTLSELNLNTQDPEKSKQTSEATPFSVLSTGHKLETEFQYMASTEGPQRITEEINTNLPPNVSTFTLQVNTRKTSPSQSKVTSADPALLSDMRTHSSTDSNLGLTDSIQTQKPEFTSKSIDSNPKVATDASSLISTKVTDLLLESSSILFPTTKSVQSNTSQNIRSFLDEGSFNERFLQAPTSTTDDSHPKSKQLLQEPLNEEALITGSEGTGSTNSVSSSQVSSGEPSVNAMSTDMVSTATTTEESLMSKVTKAASILKDNTDASGGDMEDTSPGQMTLTAIQGETTDATTAGETTDTPTKGEMTGNAAKGETDEEPNGEPSITKEALQDFMTRMPMTDAPQKETTEVQTYSQAVADTVSRKKTTVSTDKTFKPVTSIYESFTPDDKSTKATSLQQSAPNDTTPILQPPVTSPTSAESNTLTSPPHFSTETTPGASSDYEPIHYDSTETTPKGRITEATDNSKEESTDIHSKTTKPLTESFSFFQESTLSIVSSSPSEKSIVAETTTTTERTSTWGSTDASRIDTTEKPPLKIAQSKSNILRKKQSK